MRTFSKITVTLLTTAILVFAQQKVAILGTEDDGEPPLGHNELSVLTDMLREIAIKTLPKADYDIMTTQTILSFLGSQKEMERVCSEAEGCLAKIGRDIEADYIGQARLKRFGRLFSISVSIYDVKKGTLIGSFTDNSSENMYALLSVIENKAPNMFNEIHKEPSKDVKLSDKASKETQEENKTEPQVKKSFIKNPIMFAVASVGFIAAVLLIVFTGSN